MILRSYLLVWLTFLRAPIDFILHGFLGDEPVGLALIDGYSLKQIHLEFLDHQMHGAIAY